MSDERTVETRYLVVGLTVDEAMDGVTVADFVLDVLCNQEAAPYESCDSTDWDDERISPAAFVDQQTLKSQTLRYAAERDAALADLEAAREALRRLASSEAFDMPRFLDSDSTDRELVMRMDFARAALGDDTPTTGDES